MTNNYLKIALILTTSFIVITSSGCGSKKIYSERTGFSHFIDDYPSFDPDDVKLYFGSAPTPIKEYFEIGTVIYVGRRYYLEEEADEIMKDLKKETVELGGNAMIGINIIQEDEAEYRYVKGSIVLATFFYDLPKPKKKEITVAKTTGETEEVVVEEKSKEEKEKEEKERLKTVKDDQREIAEELNL